MPQQERALLLPTGPPRAAAVSCGVRLLESAERCAASGYAAWCLYPNPGTSGDSVGHDRRDFGVRNDGETGLELTEKHMPGLAKSRSMNCYRCSGMTS
jgi:hypothetical protein